MIIGFAIIGASLIHLLPDIPFDKIFQNKEKEEVKRLIGLAIEEFEMGDVKYENFLKHAKHDLSIKEGKPEIYLNANTLPEPQMFYKLMNNELFLEHCTVVAKELISERDYVKQIINQFNNPKFQPIDRLVRMKKYAILSKVIQEKLKGGLLLLGGTIDENEFKNASRIVVKSSGLNK